MAALRRIQQSYVFQILVVPALITGAIAGFGALLASAHGDLSQLAPASIKTAIGIGGAASVTYILGIIQHGLGSASFHPDGTPNAAVADVVAIQKKVEAEPDNQQAVSALQRVSTVAAINASTVKANP